MSTRAIQTDRAPRPVAAFSQAVQAGNLLQVAGQGGVDPATDALVGETIEGRTRQTRTTCRGLEAAGRDLRDVIMVRVYLTDRAHFGAMNEIYPATWPSRSRPAPPCSSGSPRGAGRDRRAGGPRLAALASCRSGSAPGWARSLPAISDGRRGRGAPCRTRSRGRRTAASRDVSGWRPKRCSIVAGSTSCRATCGRPRSRARRPGASTSAGMRVLGPCCVVRARRGRALARRRHVVPLAAELVVGHDDHRVACALEPWIGLEQVDQVARARVLARVAGVLVLGADRLDEADLRELAAAARVLRAGDELLLVAQVPRALRRARRERRRSS